MDTDGFRLIVLDRALNFEDEGQAWSMRNAKCKDKL